ncbi:MAG: MinD/ParA family protein [Actinobacteria bacterium]|nr:MinD/ParA family protein [Actinomycetota bacterium]
MYLILSEKADEFTRIKATLGAGALRVNNRHSLIEGLEANPLTRIVVITQSVKSDTAFALAAELRIQFPQINVILIRTRIDVATLAAALEYGIKDVVDAQDAAALMNAVRRCEEVAEQLTMRSGLASINGTRGKLITVYSAKGGCGKTTIASNLAAALSKDNSTSVCLVDMDLQFGDIATALRIHPTKTVTSALEMGESVDIEGLNKVLLRYENMFDVLLAPTNPSDVEMLNPEFLSKIVATLQHNYDYVVIDTSPALSEVIVRMLRDSDLVLLLTTLDMPAIKNLKLTISALDALGLSKSRRRLILNKSDLKVGLDAKDVEALVDEDISIQVPSSTKVTSASNEGQLVIQAHPHNPVSKAIFQLANQVREITHELSGTKVA